MWAIVDFKIPIPNELVEITYEVRLKIHVCNYMSYIRCECCVRSSACVFGEKILMEMKRMAWQNKNIGHPSEEVIFLD